MVEQVGGADVAEFFDVEGERHGYEPGDVWTFHKTQIVKFKNPPGPIPSW
jgi:hypothetical protein